VVVSPDPGGCKRADRLKSALAHRLQQDIGLAMMEKRRALGTLEVGRLAGDVAGATAIIVDDILATGSTLAASVAACRAQSAIAVIAAAAHGLFVAPAAELLAADALPRVLITDTVAPFRLDEAARSRVEVIGVASLLANAIGRLAANASLGDLGR
jgi:ribose-phosphate pyrophosphokinase